MLITIAHKGGQGAAMQEALGLALNQVHRAALPMGEAIGFYSEATVDRTEFCLVVDVRPARLRPQQAVHGLPIQQYVNAAPYASGAGAALAIETLLQPALARKVGASLPLDICLTSFRSTADATTLNTWLRPLGWQVTATPVGEPQAGWHTHDLRLRGTRTLRETLLHLQVLLVAADHDRHLFLEPLQTQQFLALGRELLATHPHGGALLHSMATVPVPPQPADLLSDGEALPRHKPLPEAVAAAWQQTVNRYIAEQEPLRLAQIGNLDLAWLLELVGNARVNQLFLPWPNLQDLHALIHGINGAVVDPAARQKLQLSSLSPVFKSPWLKDMDVVTVQQPLDILAEWHLDMLADNVLGHVAPPTAFWLGWGQMRFQNWASEAAANHGYQVELIPISPEHPDAFIAQFTRKND